MIRLLILSALVFQISHSMYSPALNMLIAIFEGLLTYTIAYVTFAPILTRKLQAELSRDTRKF